MSEANYASGDEYVVEFLGYRFGFNADDFEERVTAAAVRLGLIGSNDLDDEETADLVELAADGRIADARSTLGRYLVRHWDRVGLLEGESLVYWLRKLVFRGAWLDHRVKEGLLEVAWDEESGDFGYAEPRGGRALLELAPVPSWHELQFRRCSASDGTEVFQGHREADRALRLGAAERQLTDRADRDDQLPRLSVLDVRDERDEAGARLGRERGEAEQRAVGQLDLDHRLLEPVLGGERLDPAVDPRDEVVVRPRLLRCPEVAHRADSTRAGAPPAAAARGRRRACGVGRVSAT